jgi:acyl-CoA reductase-like NAD-dependent aldehyde dehydrogenase
MKKVTEYKNFIDGKWAKSHSGETFPNISPAATDDVTGIFQKMDARDINDDISTACVTPDGEMTTS